jgi:hypothetical protein
VSKPDLHAENTTKQYKEKYIKTLPLRSSLSSRRDANKQIFEEYSKSCDEC